MDFLFFGRHQTLVDILSLYNKYAFLCLALLSHFSIIIVIIITKSSIVWYQKMRGLQAINAGKTSNDCWTDCFFLFDLLIPYLLFIQSVCGRGWFLFGSILELIKDQWNNIGSSALTKFLILCSYINIYEKCLRVNL